MKIFVAENEDYDDISKIEKCVLKMQKKSNQSIDQIAKEWEALKRITTAGKNSFLVKLLNCCQTDVSSNISMNIKHSIINNDLIDIEFFSIKTINKESRNTSFI